MKTLNRNSILIIGNGFDLAHDLDTSFDGFASHYIENIIYKNIYDFNNKRSFFSLPFTRAKRINGYAGFCEYINIYNKEGDTEINVLKKNKNIIKDFISNKFLGKLFQDNYDNWFDIEQAYYDELTYVMKKKTVKGIDLPNKEKVELLKTLNLEFIEIKDAVIDYLDLVKPIKDEIIGRFLNENFSRMQKLIIINFNYTNTFNNYLGMLDYSGVEKKLINIHGTLKDNNIIFGYGDDTNEDYIKMKESGINEYLENFKTFNYLDNVIYRNTLNELENIDEFDVYVLGHSLGRTDKTILRKILGDEKCKNIHLFKRNDIADEFDKIKKLRSLSFNIARILPNDESVRDKIVPYEITNHFPFNDELDIDIIKSKINELGKEYGMDIM